MVGQEAVPVCPIGPMKALYIFCKLVIVCSEHKNWKCFLFSTAVSFIIILIQMARRWLSAFKFSLRSYVRSACHIVKTGRKKYSDSGKDSASNYFFGPVYL